MILTSNHATRPLTSELPPDQAHGSWAIAPGDPQPAFQHALVASYVCDCNGRTLFQIHRARSLDAPVQIVLSCLHDGVRVTTGFRRMPWVVEEGMRGRGQLTCPGCDQVVASTQTFDGLIVGVELACPICGVDHAVNLALNALPPEVRLAAFGMEPPRAVLSPPVYAVLQMMWECIQREPENRFQFTPYTIRDDSGILRHPATGVDAEVWLDHLRELLTAGLIEDGEAVAISKAGVIACLREFGRR